MPFRRKRGLHKDVYEYDQALIAEMGGLLARLVSAETSSDLPPSERGFWETLREQRQAAENAVAEILPQVLDRSPDEAFQATLASLGSHQTFIAKLVRFRVWESQVRALDDESFQTEASRIERRRPNRSYRDAEVEVIRQEQERRGLDEATTDAPAAGLSSEQARLVEKTSRADAKPNRTRDPHRSSYGRLSLDPPFRRLC